MVVIAIGLPLCPDHLSGDVRGRRRVRDEDEERHGIVVHPGKTAGQRIDSVRCKCRCQFKTRDDTVENDMNRPARPRRGKLERGRFLDSRITRREPDRIESTGDGRSDGRDNIRRGLSGRTGLVCIGKRQRRRPGTGRGRDFDTRENTVTGVRSVRIA